MRVRINSSWLSRGELEGPSNVRVGSQIVTQEAEFFRALAKQYWQRGNESNTVSFSVSRAHNTGDDAEFFILTHFAALSKEGTVVFEIGQGDSLRTVSLLNAVLSAIPEKTYDGSSTTTTYTIQGGAISTDAPPDIEPYEDMIRIDITAIPSGVDTVTVNFSTSFPASPRTVVAFVRKASAAAADLIALDVLGDSITSTGCIVKLSALTPDATYQLFTQSFA